jgi:NADH dehydrogenase
VSGAQPLLRVLIVVGGLAGLAAAKALAGAPVEVTLIDRRNHHVFQPLLYQVATASLSPADISAPIRSVLRGQANCQVVLAEVTGVDLAGRGPLVGGGAVGYNYLVLAAGATHAYFGHNDWAPIAPGLKSLEDAPSCAGASCWRSSRPSTRAARTLVARSLRSGSWAAGRPVSS